MLSSRVAELRAANARLAVELNRVAAARLREEARALREMLDAAEAQRAAARGKETGDEEAGTPTGTN